MARPMAMLVMLVLASACQKESPDAKKTGTVDAGYRNRLDALSVPERNATFGRAIRDAGINCQWVVQSDALKRGASQRAWRARCMEGQSFELALQQGGVLQVTGPVAAGKAHRTSP